MRGYRAPRATIENLRTGEQVPAEVGMIVGFKSDVEQAGRIVKIEGNWLTRGNEPEMPENDVCGRRHATCTAVSEQSVQVNTRSLSGGGGDILCPGRMDRVCLDGSLTDDRAERSDEGIRSRS